MISKHLKPVQLSVMISNLIRVEQIEFQGKNFIEPQLGQLKSIGNMFYRKDLNSEGEREKIVETWESNESRRHLILKLR